MSSDNIYASFKPLAVYCKFAGVLALRPTATSGFEFSWVSLEAVWPLCVCCAPMLVELHKEHGRIIKTTKLIILIASMLVSLVQAWVCVGSSRSMIELMGKMGELDWRLGDVVSRGGSGRFWVIWCFLVSLAVVATHILVPVTDRPLWLSALCGLKFLFSTLQCFVFDFFCEETRARALLLRAQWVDAVRSGLCSRLEGVRCSQALLTDLLERLGSYYGMNFFWAQVSVLVYLSSTVRRAIEDEQRIPLIAARSFCVFIAVLTFISVYAYGEKLTRCCKEFMRGSFGIRVVNLDSESQFQILYFQQQFLLSENEINCSGMFNINMFIMGSVSTVFITYAIALLGIDPIIIEGMDSLNDIYNITL